MCITYILVVHKKRLHNKPPLRRHRQIVWIDKLIPCIIWTSLQACLTDEWVNIASGINLYVVLNQCSMVVNILELSLCISWIWSRSVKFEINLETECWKKIHFTYTLLIQSCNCRDIFFGKTCAIHLKSKIEKLFWTKNWKIFVHWYTIIYKGSQRKFDSPFILSKPFSKNFQSRSCLILRGRKCNIKFKPHTSPCERNHNHIKNFKSQVDSYEHQIFYVFNYRIIIILMK